MPRTIRAWPYIAARPQKGFVSFQLFSWIKHGPIEIIYWQQQQQQNNNDEKQQQLETIKAVAQAWHGNSNSSKSSINEIDAHGRHVKSKPSRFKLEAIRKAASCSSLLSRSDGYGSFRSMNPGSNGRTWDFGESLWDSYEIVTISRRLERGLVLDHTVSSEDEEGEHHVFKMRKGSKNSLRNILNRMSSRRFNEPHPPQDEEVNPSIN